MGFVPIFPDAEEMNIPTLLFMMVVYGFILFNASCYISDGSELLLLLYGPGIVGGLLIPILGAVPDCMVILLSGLGSGSKSEIQHELAVGVGTLVGSTVMLISVPWALGIFFGRRDFDKQTNQAANQSNGKPLCTKASLIESCVTVLPAIPRASIIMMVVSLTYLIIQLPAFKFHNDADQGVQNESPYALSGLIISLFFFISYCVYQTVSASSEENVLLKESLWRQEQWKKHLDKRLNQDIYQHAIFTKFDTDQNGYLNQAELSKALSSLGLLEMGRRDVSRILSEMDGSGGNNASERDGRISLEEFKYAVNNWMKLSSSKDRTTSKSNLIDTPATSLTQSRRDVLAQDLLNDIKLSNKDKDVEANSEKDDEDEDKEEDEAHWELTDSQIKTKAFLYLFIATVVVAIVSDPMVDVISSLGTQMNISPFYISFVVTPIASNASEVVSGIFFAKKKTVDSITVTLATLFGAASMNSTLGLGIFLCLVYFRNLSWSFSAESLSVIIAILVVGLNALRTNIFLWQACLVFAVYPFTILFVFLCENVFGLD